MPLLLPLQTQQHRQQHNTLWCRLPHNNNAHSRGDARVGRETRTRGKNNYSTQRQYKCREERQREIASAHAARRRHHHGWWWRRAFVLGAAAGHSASAAAAAAAARGGGCWMLCANNRNAPLTHAHAMASATRRAGSRRPSNGSRHTCCLLCGRAVHITSPLMMQGANNFLAHRRNTNTRTHTHTVLVHHHHHLHTQTRCPES